MKEFIQLETSGYTLFSSGLYKLSNRQKSHANLHTVESHYARSH